MFIFDFYYYLTAFFALVTTLIIFMHLLMADTYYIWLNCECWSNLVKVILIPCGAPLIRDVQPFLTGNNQNMSRFFNCDFADWLDSVRGSLLIIGMRNILIYVWIYFLLSPSDTIIWNLNQCCCLRFSQTIKLGMWDCRLSSWLLIYCSTMVRGHPLSAVFMIVFPMIMSGGGNQK